MAYIFDFFGVISSEISNFWFTKYLPSHNITELRKRYVIDADLGKLPLHAFYNELAKLSGQKSEEIAKQWRELAIINEEVVSVIKHLRKSSRIALCSNAPADLIRPILKENQLESLFDVIVISGEVGMVKPNKDIFTHTLTLLGVVANQTTFIDDSETNIHAARELGINCILYKNPSDIVNLP